MLCCVQSLTKGDLMNWQSGWLRPLALVVLGNVVFLSLAFATPGGNAPAAAATPTPVPLSDGEQRIVDQVAELTKVEVEQPVARTFNDDSEVVELNSGFGAVTLSRTDAAGNLVTRCVTSAEEALAFLREELPTPSIMRERTVQPVPSEAEVNQLIRASTISIVNRDGSGEGFNDATPATPVGGNTGSTLGQQRLRAFQYAAALWSQQLDTNVPIQIDATFDPLQCTSTGAVLGSAGPNALRAFETVPSGPQPGSAFANTWYPIALGNKLAGSDATPTSGDITARFNSSFGTSACANFRFYLGLDANTPAGQDNLVIVLLHELAHGLGFISIVDEETGQLFSGQGEPRIDIFSRYLFDNQIGKAWGAMTDAERRASAINNRGSLVWSGPNVAAAAPSIVTTGADSAGRLRMYAPNPVRQGSSVSHWDTTIRPDLLMEPFLEDQGLSLDLTVPLFRDIGWFVDRNNDGFDDTVRAVRLPFVLRR
jgi:hypothetical protein